MYALIAKYRDGIVTGIRRAAFMTTAPGVVGPTASWLVGPESGACMIEHQYAVHCNEQMSKISEPLKQSRLLPQTLCLRVDVVPAVTAELRRAHCLDTVAHMAQ